MKEAFPNQANHIKRNNLKKDDDEETGISKLTNATIVKVKDDSDEVQTDYQFKHKAIAITGEESILKEVVTNLSEKTTSSKVTATEEVTTTEPETEDEIESEVNEKENLIETSTTGLKFFPEDT